MAICCVTRLELQHISNSSPPTAAYMRRWTGSSLFQVMACPHARRQAITWNNADFLSIGPIGTNFNEWIYKIFIHENPLENAVCEMAATLFRGRWVDIMFTDTRFHTTQFRNESYNTTLVRTTRGVANGSQESLYFTYCSQNKRADILQAIFSNAYPGTIKFRILNNIS